MRLVVLRALGLGDVLTAVPALRALRRRFPDHRITLAAPRVLEPLVGLSGAVDDVVHTEALQPLDPALAGADVAVNLHGRGPQSSQLLTAAAPGRLLAFHHPDIAATRDGPTWQADEHEVVRWCRLLDHYGIEADPTALRLPPPAVEPPARAVGATVVHPGAASGSRRWPAHRWAEVAGFERSQGRPVVVTGSPQEAPLARAVAEAAGLDAGAVLAGRTDLSSLAAVVAAAGRVVCGDTGVAHLASAFATPSVVLFGPTPPAQWGPPPGPHRVLWHGRLGDPHGDELDPGLAAITVAEVLAALQQLGEREAA